MRTGIFYLKFFATAMISAVASVALAVARLFLPFYLLFLLFSALIHPPKFGSEDEAAKSE